MDLLESYFFSDLQKYENTPANLRGGGKGHYRPLSRHKESPHALYKKQKRNKMAKASRRKNRK